MGTPYNSYIQMRKNIDNSVNCDILVSSGENMHKKNKRVFAAGMLGLLLTFAIVLAGCDDIFGREQNRSGNGTVILTNDSTFDSDNQVFAGIYNYNTMKYIQTGYVNKNSSITFSGLPTGVELSVDVLDGEDYEWESATFTLSSGQTMNYRFTGIAVVPQ